MTKDAVATDDTYDELESVLSGKGTIPGDEFTGVIEVKADDDKIIIIDDKTVDDKDGDDKTTDKDKDNEDDKITNKDDKDTKGGEGSDDDSTAGKSDKDDPDKDKDKGTVGKDDQDQTSAQILEENSKLRQDLRDQRKISALSQAKIDRILTRLDKQDTKAAADAAEDDEDEEIEDKAAKTVSDDDEELSDIEVFQNEIDSIAERRGETFGEMVELMSLNPKFEDVKEVCSRQNLDDILEAAAEGKVQQEGGDITTAQLAVEVSIWRKSNPYKYMYEVIKKYHPKYAETDDTTDKDKDDKSKVKGDPPDEKAKSRSKELTKTATSALDFGSSDNKNLGEWTAERIDKMDESELHKVPVDIYEMYMSGKLGK